MKQRPEYLGKMVFDLVGAACLFLCCLPFFVLIGIIIKLDSRGPVFYRHPRVGKDGRVFKMWKFRTMVPGADKMAGGLTQHGDPRITRVGRLLRRYSLDELPQIINVLSGEMSLVGPRPEIPQLVQEYTPEQRQALSVRPGITGLTQINGRDDLPMDRKLQIERNYVEQNSLWLDLKILFRTLPAVVSGEGARY